MWIIYNLCILLTRNIHVNNKLNRIQIIFVRKFLFMKNTKISQILNRLMADKKIRVTELARLVNLPQPTIHRIATGVCEHPHSSSLEPIANFFAISIEQLKGHEPIPWLDHATRVPLLTWEQVLHWPQNKGEIHIKEFILTDALIGKKGFALKIKDNSMDPVFTRNTILIADPEKEIKDRSFVIAKIANHAEAIFRQLLFDAGIRYLKSLSPDFEKYKMLRLNNTGKVLSIVVQAKRDFAE